MNYFRSCVLTAVCRAAITAIPEIDSQHLRQPREFPFLAYEGVSIATILQHAAIPMGADARGPHLMRYALITAADGYAAVFSLAELDPRFTGQPVLLADHRDGRALTESEGTPRLVVPADKRQRRWINRVVRIEVRRATVQPLAMAPRLPATTDGSE